MNRKIRLSEAGERGGSRPKLSGRRHRGNLKSFQSSPVLQELERSADEIRSPVGMIFVRAVSLLIPAVGCPKNPRSSQQIVPKRTFGRRH